MKGLGEIRALMLPGVTCLSRPSRPTCRAERIGGRAWVPKRFLRRHRFG
jgi:hypothetical protein